MRRSLLMLQISAILIASAGLGRAETSRPNSLQNNQIKVDQIIDAAAGDWNGDGLRDLAILADSNDPDDDIGLYIYLRDPDTQMLKQALALPNKFWGRTHSPSGMAGQEASIAPQGSSSIAVTTQNSSIGRERWESKLSIAYRNKQFVVAGFTHNSFDTLQKDSSLNCDLNLLSGKGMVNGKPVTFKSQSIRLDKWEEGDEGNPGMKICSEH